MPLPIGCTLAKIVECIEVAVVVTFVKVIARHSTKAIAVRASSRVTAVRNSVARSCINSFRIATVARVVT